MLAQSDDGPVVVSVRRSRYGYFIVTVSVAPGRRVEIMVADRDITADQALRAALAATTGRTAGRPPRP
jgi:hypothetical protein